MIDDEITFTTLRKWAKGQFGGGVAVNLFVTKKLFQDLARQLLFEWEERGKPRPNHLLIWKQWAIAQDAVTQAEAGLKLGLRGYDRAQVFQLQESARDIREQLVKLGAL